MISLGCDPPSSDKIIGIVSSNFELSEGAQLPN